KYEKKLKIFLSPNSSGVLEKCNRQLTWLKPLKKRRKSVKSKKS
ncbi:Uncharacterized protein APZ42_009089, partial [Daphnia magna]